MINTHESRDCCWHCGQKWQDHYHPELLRYKMGPFGTFGLIADHTPAVPFYHGRIRTR